MKKVVVLLLAFMPWFVACENSSSNSTETLVTKAITSEGGEHNEHDGHDHGTSTATKEEDPNAEYPEMTFAHNSFDFGTIKEGEKVEHTFTFTNTGKANLIISNATSTCGCTVPEFRKDPIKPGESSEIKVVFNSSGKEGQQSKPVTITSNVRGGVTKLDFGGMVIKEKAVNGPFKSN